MGVLLMTDPNYDADAASSSHGSVNPQAEMPFGIRINAGWRAPFTGLLCSEPPYGRNAAIDLKTREVLWDRPFGTSQKNGPFGIPSMLPFEIGTANNGSGHDFMETPISDYFIVYALSVLSAEDKSAKQP